ncbi:acyltransferase domain-containing protein [Streptomyces sp. SJ1-7]|nr:acyltransferase domain-containing protein [Streptomyces sp. SJ1-7]
MGDGLRQAFPAFAAAHDAALAALDPHLDRPLGAIVSGDERALHRTEYTQAGLFAFEVAMFRLLESWGVHPDLLAGHSVGEIAAAHTSGPSPSRTPPSWSPRAAGSCRHCPRAAR